MNYDRLIQLFYQQLSHIYPEGEVRAIFRTLAETYEQLSLVSLHLFADREVNHDSEIRYLHALELLKKHIPVQHITGRAWFMDLQLCVNPDVLIPRPETEELVNLLIEMKPKAGDRILDLCTGSGCIALAAANYLPQTDIWAVDISAAALKVAIQNSQKLELPVKFIQADILAELQEDWPTFQYIVSNPPYIPLSEAPAMDNHVALHEPHQALFVPEEDPLLFYKALSRHASRLLEPQGPVIMECHGTYASEVANLFIQNGFCDVTVLEDLSGKKRFVKALKCN
jgi:release factor glutamine methyltransferase